jgi:hypothetical protein
MPTYTTRYIPTTATLLIGTDADADTLLPNEDIMAWSRALRAGKTAEGQPLKHIAVVFADPGCAEYNHHALGFAQIDTLVGTLDNPARFHHDDPADFSTRDDFGL